MKIPRVSICIPAFQAERYLEATLASVGAQTFTDWELIVTEDGSQDRAESLVRAFADTTSQSVRYTRHEENRGLPATRNTGLAEARGRWVALLDADDLWLPEHLARCLAALETQRAALAFAGCAIFDSASGEVIEQRTAAPENLAVLPQAIHRGAVVIQPSAVVFERQLWERLGGFDPAFPICNDLDFWLRVAESGARLAFSGSDTVCYRKHPAAMSSRSADLIAETGRVFWKHRTCPGVPRPQRRAAVRSHFRHAARMNARQRPALAARQMLCSLLAPLAIY